MQFRCALGAPAGAPTSVSLAGTTVHLGVDEPCNQLSVISWRLVGSVCSLLNGLLSNCDGWHPERCRDVKDMRLAAKPLQISPQELLDQAEVCEFASDSVGRIATEVSEELGTELLHTTFEDLVRAGSDGGMGLPSSVESFLGLRPGEYEINVDGFFKGDAHKASHPKRKDGPRLAADIQNFEEVRQYFEEHATPHRLQMLME